jgi:Kef-type K+ transport system membrane component KefB
MSSLPYHEPDRITILTQSSFLLLLNIIESVLNRALYCGLLGQVILGIAFGAPGGNLLSHEAQTVIVQLGYLGLILLVYEGGLSVPLVSLKANIGLSTAVACTGIAVPIALSFILQPLLNATPLQAFAAGAALCSTSLGTTFTVLSTSGLANTGLGSVLSTAAMMDDVVGLVMVQAIANLGLRSGSFNTTVVVRPVLVSLAFAILVPAILRYMVRPLRNYALTLQSIRPRVDTLLANERARFILQSLILFSLVAAAAWSGTSVLFTAYLAGAIVNWWDSQDSLTLTEERSSVVISQRNDHGRDTLSSNRKSTENTTNTSPDIRQVAPIPVDLVKESDKLSGISIYHTYLEQLVNRLLRPLFFVSDYDWSSLLNLVVNRIFTGKHWLLHSYNESFQRTTAVAWSCLCYADDSRKACLWHMAHAVQARFIFEDPEQ